MLKTRRIREWCLIPRVGTKVTGLSNLCLASRPGFWERPLILRKGLQKDEEETDIFALAAPSAAY